MDVPKTDSSVPIPKEDQVTFSGGMRDRDHPSLLAPNQYSYGKNIEIRDSGLAKKREGRTSKTTAVGGNPQGGIFFKPDSGSSVLVTVNNGKTYTWDGSSGSVTQLGTTQFSNQTNNVGMVILNGKLFIFPGTSDNAYSWNGSAGALTDEGNTNSDPQRASLVCQQAGRICLSGAAASNQDYIYFSDIFDGTTWDRTTNLKRTPTDGSEAVTALATYRKEEILAWTAFSTHLWNITGSSISSFSRTTLDAKIGCIAPRSAVVIGDDAFFLSSDLQLRTIKRTVQDLAFGVTNPVTYFVPNLMERINDSYANLCAGIFFNNYFLLASPMDSNTRNSSIIVFDMLHQFGTPSGNVPVCVGEWTNMAVNQFVVSYFNNIARLHYIDSNDGSIKQMFDGTSNDDGTEISPQIDFRAFDYQNPNHLKTAHDGLLQFVNSSGTATLSFAKDDGVFNSIGTKTIGDQSATLPVNLPFNLPVDSGVTPWYFSMYKQGRSRYWQPKLTFSGTDMNLKQATLRSFVEGYTTR